MCHTSVFVGWQTDLDNQARQDKRMAQLKKTLSLALGVVLLCVTLVVVESVPYDLLNNRYMDFNWLEFGQVSAPAYDNFAPWTTVTTTTIIPETAGTVLGFLSIPQVDDVLPQIGGSVTALPPLVPKMNGLPSRNPDGTYTFEFRLVFPNDSYCSKEWYEKRWYTPASSSLSLRMTWLVAVEGVYSILTNFTDQSFNTNFVIGSGNLTRASANPTVSGGNAIQFRYPKGCDNEPDEFCFVSSTCGAVQQLQTSINKVDGGRELFLSVRAWQVLPRSSWFVLVPHDASTSSYFVIPTAETLGFIVFPTGQTVTCIEGFAFETRVFPNITSRPVVYEFFNTYIDPPGVFGMIQTVVSMVDSTSLSVYSIARTNSTIITKEDQCVDEEFEHITPEIISLLVVGRTNDIPWLECFAIYGDDPTPAPTVAPTARQCLTLDVIK